MEEIEISFEDEFLSVEDLSDSELHTVLDEINRLYARLALPLSARARQGVTFEIGHWISVLVTFNARPVRLSEHGYVFAQPWELTYRAPACSPVREETCTLYDAHCIISEMNGLCEVLARDLPRFFRRALEESLQGWAWDLDEYGYDARLTSRGYVLRGSSADYADMQASLLECGEELANALVTRTAPTRTT